MSTTNNNIEIECFGRVSSLWLNRDYLLLWSGQVISSIGSGISEISFPLLILAITGSPAQAGFISAMSVLPYLVFSLPAGALVDRWDRKRVMMYCDTGRALKIGSIPLALAIGHLLLIQLYFVAFVEGTLFVFFNIAQAACLPSVVSEEQLPTAVAQNFATTGITGLLSPSLGGTLYSIMQSLPFVADAISYTASIFSLFLIKKSFQQERVVTSRKLHIQIGEGLSWIWHQPLIRFLALKSFIGNLTQSGSTLIIIVLAQHQHASSFTIGLIFAIGGFGTVLGALAASPLQKRLSFGQAIITSSWFWTVLWPLYVFVPNPLTLGILVAANFFVSPIHNVVLMSYRLALIPDELRGRVTSTFRLISYGSTPLGLALTGILIQNINVGATVLILWVGLCTSTIATTLYPRVRNAPPINEKNFVKESSR